MNTNRKSPYQGKKAGHQDEALAEAHQLVIQEAMKLHDRFGGHSIQYYYEEILHQSHFTKGQRSVTAWNAFLGAEVKCINDGKWQDYHHCFVFLLMMTHHLERPEGEERQKAPALAPEIAERWNSMSPSEQKAATKDLINDLQDRREMKALSTRNIPVEAFHDAQATIKNLEREASHYLFAFYQYLTQ